MNEVKKRGFKMSVSYEYLYPRKSHMEYKPITDRQRSDYDNFSIRFLMAKKAYESLITEGSGKGWIWWGDDESGLNELKPEGTLVYDETEQEWKDRIHASNPWGY